MIVATKHPGKHLKLNLAPDQRDGSVGFDSVKSNEEAFYNFPGDQHRN
jgi:hypothetical protein